MYLTDLRLLLRKQHGMEVGRRKADGKSAPDLRLSNIPQNWSGAFFTITA